MRYKRSVKDYVDKTMLIIFCLAMLTPDTILAGEWKRFDLFRELIHMPTAGIFPVGGSDIDMRIYSNSGIHLSASLGLRNNTTVGFTLGGENIIGDGLPEWNPQIEFDVRYRMVDETQLVPAMAVGFDSQGFGSYHDNSVYRLEKNELGEYVNTGKKVRVDRYDYKSRGLYLVASKNYPFLGRIGFHAGVNLSLETKDGDNDLDLFVGLDKSINKTTFFMLEYDTALNDNDYKYQAEYDKRTFGSDQSLGYLNIGLRWLINDRFSMEGALTDVFESAGTYGRELRMTYLTDLFESERKNTKDDNEENEEENSLEISSPHSEADDCYGCDWQGDQSYRPSSVGSIEISNPEPATTKTVSAPAPAAEKPAVVEKSTASTASSFVPTAAIMVEPQKPTAGATIEVLPVSPSSVVIQTESKAINAPVSNTESEIKK